MKYNKCKFKYCGNHTYIASNKEKGVSVKLTEKDGRWVGIDPTVETPGWPALQTMTELIKLSNGYYILCHERLKFLHLEVLGKRFTLQWPPIVSKATKELFFEGDLSFLNKK